MKRFTLLKTMLLLCALIVGSSYAWGDEATITFANTNGNDSSSELTTSNFVENGITSSDAAFGTILCTATEKCYKGKSGFGLKVGGSGNAGSFTIIFQTPLTNVTKITLNRASYASDKTTTITVKNGTTTLANAVSTPSGSADLSNMEITGLSISPLSSLTVESGKYCYIKSITITYSGGGGSYVSLPTFSPTDGIKTSAQDVTIACATDGAIIHYTTDGTDPDEDSPTYSSAISVTSTTTIKAMAVKDGMNNSEIATATYYIVYPEASLPFAFNGGIADIEKTSGLTYTELGTDYNTTNTKLKFDTANDDLVLRINEIPGELTFSIKGNSFSGGTFTVQESADGTNYKDVESYTTLSGSETTKTITKLDLATRYIKWVYTTKSSGNVGLGNISLTAKVEPISITAAGYATYVSDNDLDYSGVTGLKAYKAKVSGNSIAFTRVTTVPAGEGVLLRATSELAESTVFNIPVTTDVDAWAESDNDFIRGTGATVATQVGSNYNYILSTKGGVVGFYNANGNTVANNRAYLSTTTAPKNNSRLSTTFDDDETTGINAVENVEQTMKDAVIYNLNGQRVVNPIKGLYIVNGKKVIFNK